MRGEVKTRAGARGGFIAVEVVLSVVILLCCFIVIGRGMAATMSVRERSVRKYGADKNTRGVAVEAVAGVARP